MQPEIDVLGISIKTFGVFFALNFVAWGALVSRRLRELGKPPDWAYEMVAVALVDMAGPGLALGYAIGRIGCQVSGDGDYGRAWDGPWAMGYPHGTVPTAPGVTVHPTPIYETLVMGLLAYVLWQLRDRVRPGVLFALYLVCAGAERFLIEFIRRNDEVAFGLTAAQLESLSLFVVGAVWLFVVGRRGGLLRDDAPGRRRDAVPATT